MKLVIGANILFLKINGIIEKVVPMQNIGRSKSRKNIFTIIGTLPVARLILFSSQMVNVRIDNPSKRDPTAYPFFF